MKTPTAKKLPSGSWYCRVRVRGQDISITRDTKKEAVAEAMAIKAGIRLADRQAAARQQRLTVREAIDEYISARRNVLSPATIRGYRTIQRNRFQQAMHLRISDISKRQWQRIVNDEASACSAKTLKNAWGLVSSVIKECLGVEYHITLPQVVDKDLPFLTYEEIEIFTKVIRGLDFEIPALLALSSLRRSEILALQWDNVDFDRQLIYVKGAVVPDENNHMVYKPENKNRKSRRPIPIIPQLYTALLRERKSGGSIVTGYPAKLYYQVNRICRENGLPEVGVHGLRRSFASLANHLGFSEKTTMAIGGWSNPYTVHRFYTKIAEKDLVSESAVLIDFFSAINEEIGDENADENQIMQNFGQ